MAALQYRTGVGYSSKSLSDSASCLSPSNLWSSEYDFLRFYFADLIQSCSFPDHKPTYPTSSKKATNWDRLANDAMAEEAKLAKAHEKDPNAQGDKKLNELFQQLYADATDDQRRAMVKSYSESNGTSLSTVWDEVGHVGFWSCRGRFSDLFANDLMYIFISRNAWRLFLLR